MFFFAFSRLATSRSGSPSSRLSYVTYGYRGDADAPDGSPSYVGTLGRPRRLASGIPRSTHGSRDASRETSPNRFGALGGHLYDRSFGSKLRWVQEKRPWARATSSRTWTHPSVMTCRGNCFRRFNLFIFLFISRGRHGMSPSDRPPISTGRPVMAQKILQQSREAESALADALVSRGHVRMVFFSIVYECAWSSISFIQFTSGLSLKFL